MARKQASGGDEQQIDLTPMLDVVFIMLIFFIVTATFIKLPGLDVVRAPADNATGLKPSMLVALGSDGTIWINREEVDPRFLKSRITTLYAENPNGAMVIQADEESKVEQITQVADAAKEVGVVSIQIGTDEG